MFLQEQIKDIIIIIMPHYLLRLRHLLLLVSEPRLLHGRLRVLGVLRQWGVSSMRPQLVHVWHSRESECV